MQQRAATARRPAGPNSKPKPKAKPAPEAEPPLFTDEAEEEDAPVEFQSLDDEAADAKAKAKRPARSTVQLPPPSDHAEHMEIAESTPLHPTWAAALLAGIAALLFFGSIVSVAAAVTSDFTWYFGAAAVVTLMFSVFLFVLLVAGRSRTIRRIAMSRFDVTRQLSATEVIQGDVLRVRLDASRCSWPEGLVVRIREAPVPGFETGAAVVLKQPRIVDFKARAQRRGKQPFTGVEVLMRDEVGLWEHSRIYRLEDWVEVRPGLPALQLRSMLTARSAFPDGAPRALVHLFRDVEHESLRDYSPGDRMKDVDWKRMSATQRMMVRDVKNESLNVGLILVDAGASMRLVEGGRRNLDAALESASEIIEEAARRNHQIGLVAFDESRVIEEVRPSRSRTLPVDVQEAFQRLADRRPPSKVRKEEEPEPLAVRLQRVLRGMAGSQMGVLLLTDLETVDESVIQLMSRLGGGGTKVGALILPQPSMDAKRAAYRKHGVKPPQGYRGGVHRRELREVLSVQGIETMDIVVA